VDRVEAEVRVRDHRVIAWGSGRVEIHVLDAGGWRSVRDQYDRDGLLHPDCKAARAAMDALLRGDRAQTASENTQGDKGADGPATS